MSARSQAANRRYAIGTAAVLGVLLLLSFGVWWFRPVQTDEATLCPTDRRLAAHTLVIVDRTDRWNPAVGATLTELIENAQRNTRSHERFSIVSMDSAQSTRPLFSVCNPGAPNLASDLYRGRRYTDRDFEQRFIGASEGVLEQLRRPTEARNSPIVEYMHRWLGRDDFNASTPNRRVILISDMRQNSPEVSMYREGGRAELTRYVQQQIGPDARGVTFDVYFLAHGRDRNVSETDVREAWDQAFRGISARYVWRQVG